MHHATIILLTLMQRRVSRHLRFRRRPRDFIRNSDRSGDGFYAPHVRTILIYRHNRPSGI